MEILISITAIYEWCDGSQVRSDDKSRGNKLLIPMELQQNAGFSHVGIRSIVGIFHNIMNASLSNQPLQEPYTGISLFVPNLLHSPISGEYPLASSSFERPRLH